jgi:hypothetical protein
MKLGALLIVEIVSFVVDHEIENEALGEICGLIKDEAAIRNVSAEHHDPKGTQRDVSRPREAMRGACEDHGPESLGGHGVSEHVALR